MENNAYTLHGGELTQSRESARIEAFEIHKRSELFSSVNSSAANFYSNQNLIKKYSSLILET